MTRALAAVGWTAVVLLMIALILGGHWLLLGASGQAVIAPTPCTAYETAVQAASTQRGFVLRLACATSEPV